MPVAAPGGTDTPRVKGLGNGTVRLGPGRLDLPDDGQHVSGEGIRLAR